MNCSAVSDWSLRTGIALRKLVRGLLAVAVSTPKQTHAMVSALLVVRFILPQPEATKTKELCRRTDKSHDRSIQEIKQEVMEYLPPRKKGCNRKAAKSNVVRVQV